MSNPDPSTHDELKEFAFQYFDGKTIMNIDDLTVVVRGHLVIESFLEQLLKKHMDLSEFDGQDDLTFSRKLKMVQGLGLLGDLYPSIRRLNKIRNDFAHDIRMQLQDVDISLFVELFERRGHGNDSVWKASQENKKARLGIAIHYLLGFLAALIESSE